MTTGAGNRAAFETRGRVSPRIVGVLHSVLDQPTINSPTRSGNHPISRSDKYVGAGPGVLGVDRPHPMIAPRSCTNSVLNASVFHGEAVYHFAEGRERILPARDQVANWRKVASAGH